MRKTSVEKGARGAGCDLCDAKEALKSRRVKNDVSILLKRIPIITLSGSRIFKEAVS
jgi:hypothetical protein